jgi:guanylate kinase
LFFSLFKTGTLAAYPTIKAGHVAEATKLHRIIVLSGPSGSGKSTIVNRLVERAPVKLVKAISATTRRPRAGEKEGQDYYFLSQDEFERRRLAGDFLEYAEVFGSGSWYGTLKGELERAEKAGGWALLEIDVEGAKNVARAYPETVTIFLTAADDREYEQRLRGRGTETEEAVQRRLAVARKELAESSFYRYRVVNDQLDRAVDEIAHILIARENELNAG